jgi:hypothetical protein
MKIKFNRILWLQPDLSVDTLSSNVKGLEMLGVKVMVFDYREHVLRVGISGARKHILDIIDDFAPDLVLATFVANNFELSPEFLGQISSKTSLVIHAGDDEVYGTWQTIYFAQSADAVMTADFGGRYMYEQLFIPTVYFRSPPLDFMDSILAPQKTIDVSFLGDCARGNRAEYIKWLRENGIEVSTYGNGSENGFVSRGKFLEIISKSKINLNFTGRDVPSEILKREPWRMYFRHLSGRAFEAARLKSFCLSEYCLGLDEMLSIGREVDIFHNKEDLLAKVKYYLENDAKREEIAVKAYEKVKAEFDDLGYLSRSYNLLHDKLCENKNRIKGTDVFRSFDFNASEVKGNFFIFVKLLGEGRFVLALDTMPYFLNFNRSCLVGLWRGMAELFSRAMSSVKESLFQIK